jgi:hypothetical protein
MKRSMAALIIGVADYPGASRLANPVHDAEDLAAKLTGYGFEVILAVDCTRKEMERQLKAFRAMLDSHDVGLFFFAGHGMQIDGTNYLLATDTDTDSEFDAKHGSLSLDVVVDAMAKSTASTKIVILDACRNNPWERAWHRSPTLRGLASVYAPKGTIIGFATSPGEYALDGTGRNGTYTAALLDHIDTPDSSIETMFKRVRNSVAAASSGRQTSWEHTSLAGEFYFNLSIGKVVDEYADTALADGLFVPDPTRKSHAIIKGLKSSNWYSQNAALQRLDAESANKMSRDNLFVLGRNIYQAACGKSGHAMAFIDGFIELTHGYDARRRKAILDGMLFEVFFDPEAKLRDDIKGGAFDDLFALERHAGLKDSFDFIAEVLTAARADVYVIPGKGLDLAVTVATSTKQGKTHVDAIYVGGVDVLRPEDEDDDDDAPARYLSMSQDRLKNLLVEELVVPSKHLKLTFTPIASGKKDKLLFPSGWTVKRGRRS